VKASGTEIPTPTTALALIAASRKPANGELGRSRRPTLQILHRPLVQRNKSDISMYPPISAAHRDSRTVTCDYEGFCLRGYTVLSHRYPASSAILPIEEPASSQSANSIHVHVHVHIDTPSILGCQRHVGTLTLAFESSTHRIRQTTYHRYP
jgi:hypothetical protein